MAEQDGAVRCGEIEAMLDAMRAEMLTNAEIDKVAKRAVDMAFQQMYEEVGKSVVKRALWVIGVGALGLMVWLSSKGMDLK